MKSTEGPVIAVLPYELRHTQNLGEIKSSDLLIPLGQVLPSSINSVSDLREVDHLIVYCCSKSLYRSYTNLRCKVNLLVSEPPAVQARYYFLIPFFAKKFHSILTFSDRLIAKIPNGVFHPGASLWVDPNKNFQKSALVSIIASTKAKTEGQRMRHQVIRTCDRLGIRLDQFGRGYREVKDKEEALEPYMFSVCIENSAERNYFTEKLIDCFAQKVIPIYWGAPNVSEFFDPDGIIFCKTYDQVIENITKVKAELYDARLPAIEKNYRLACAYGPMDYMAAKKISEIFMQRVKSI
jgi:hypothetical protein